MKYNLITAAEAIGVSKATMHRYVKKGRVSATRTADGFFEIDPSELHRVFPPVSRDDHETVSGVVSRDAARRGETTSETGRYAPVLEAQLEGLKALIAEKERRITDLEADRRDLKEDRDRLLKLIEEATGTVKLLTHQTAAQQAPEAPRSLWERVFGRKGTNTRAA